MPKMICPDCSWRGQDHDLLRAANPFDASEVITGCPNCHSVNDKPWACDEPGCWWAATCGTPTDDGYRSTCNEHRPRQKEAADG
jgi:hypothetical protein